MATYTYDDTFITNSIDTIELDAAEAKALQDLDKQGFTDPFYVEELCKCLVYIDLAIKQSESGEEMQKRVTQYTKVYDRYRSMQDHNGSDAAVGSVEIGRS